MLSVFSPGKSSLITALVSRTSVSPLIAHLPLDCYGVSLKNIFSFKAAGKLSGRIAGFVLPHGGKCNMHPRLTQIKRRVIMILHQGRRHILWTRFRLCRLPCGVYGCKNQPHAGLPAGHRIRQIQDKSPVGGNVNDALHRSLLYRHHTHNYNINNSALQG